MGEAEIIRNILFARLKMCTCCVCMSWTKGGKLHGPMVIHLAIVMYNVVAGCGVCDGNCIYHFSHFTHINYCSAGE